MKKSIFFFLFLIFLFGYFLRVMFLSQGVLTFGYDQARDAINSLQITNGHLKIFGPPASQPGLFHGVFYYYVLAPAYLLGHGSPIVASYWIAFINCLTVFIVFYLTYLVTKKNLLASFVASFLFAVSFESTQYATWLSNPTLGVITVPLMYLGLWLWTKEEKKLGPIVTGVGLGLSVQSEIFLVYQAVPLAIWLLVCKKTITRKQLSSFLFFLLLSISTMMFAQIKFGIGETMNGLRSIAVNGDSSLAYAKSIGDYLVLYLNQIGRIFAFNSYPGNVGYGGMFVIILGIIAFKRFPLLSAWLFSHLTVVTLGGISTPFLMVGIGPAVSIIIAIYLEEWWSKNYKLAAALVFIVLVFGNLSMIFKENKSGSTLFAIQKDMLLSKQISLIDYTYEKSGGNPFSINSLTSPLYINIVWTYLYKWYGEPKYGYLPAWHGRDQVGQLISLPKVDKPDTTSFLILEPMGGIPSQYLDLTIGEEDSKTKVIDEKDFGELRVQERIKI